MASSAVPKRHSSVSRVVNNVWYAVVMVLSPYRIEYVYLSNDITYFFACLFYAYNMISPRNEVCSNNDNDTDVPDEVTPVTVLVFGGKRGR